MTQLWKRRGAPRSAKPYDLPRLITEPFTTWIWTPDGGREVTVSPEQANAMVRADDAKWDREHREDRP